MKNKTNEKQTSNKSRQTSKEILDLQRKAEKASRGKGDKKCPKGQILRAAYFSKSGKPVPPKCIEDRGNPGKGLYDKNGEQVVIRLRKGRLEQYGYSDVLNKSESQRIKALKKALSQRNDKGELQEDWLSIFRRLIVTSTMTKNTDPKRSEIFRQDAEWVKTKGKAFQNKKRDNDETQTKKR